MKLFDEFDGVTCDGDLLEAGFIQVPIKILIDDRISPGAKLAYAALLYYNFRNRPYPGHRDCALDFSIPERSLKRYLRELVSAGHLQVLRRGRGQPNSYHLPQLQLELAAADPRRHKVSDLLRPDPVQALEKESRTGVREP